MATALIPPAIPRANARRLAPGAWAFVPFVIAVVTSGCSGDDFDPTAQARSARSTYNVEAHVPAQCYASTRGGANTCWTCHTIPLVATNLQRDFDLQRTLSFSRAGRTNHFTNVLIDRGAEAASLADSAVLDWIRTDNYAPLQRALARQPAYDGFVPDLNLASGFDDEGFARDESGWRAVRYKPFPGMGWPSNGSVGDVFVRLPHPFRVDASGAVSRGTYRANLAILEMAIASDPRRDDAAVGLPVHYGGGASDVAVRRASYPVGTELLHSVRYLDPDAPGMFARRMKELRHMRKTQELGDWAIGAAYEHEASEKAEGKLPRFRGDPSVGLESGFGWRMQAFIEDARGRLRVQTDEELRFCMGCHSNVGVTVDQTFSFARKVPGPGGWLPQDLAGMKDVPQVGHPEPEALTYARRAGRADDFGANDELRARFFRPDGAVDGATLRRAAPGGDRDLAWLLTPSRARALALDRGYMTIVAAQSFVRGRDAPLAPAPAVLRRVDEDVSGIDEAAVRTDGRLHLAW